MKVISKKTSHSYFNIKTNNQHANTACLKSEKHIMSGVNNLTTKILNKIYAAFMLNKLYLTTNTSINKLSATV